jgi:hypothetical protein
MLAAVAALFSVAAAVSAHLMRTRVGSRAASADLGELERAVEDLVRRLEITAGRCAHDLQSREERLRRLLAGAEVSELAPQPALAPIAAAAVDSDTRVGRELVSCPTGERAEGELLPYFGSDLVSRAAQACELAERETDEATICRVTGLQRGELRLLLSLRQAQGKAA